MTAGRSSVAHRGDVADLAGLLAAWWSRPVPAEVASWREAAGVAHELAERLSIPSQPPAVPPADQERALLDEYEKLFVGPGPVPCPPYESFWRSDVPVALRRSLMGPCTAGLAEIYRSLGLEVASASGELPDHVAVELEAFACALGREDTLPAASVLLSDHLRTFLTRLCRAVAGEAEMSFYRQLAGVTTAWLDLSALLPDACG
jgi:TorA maturation chaperone TorD